MRGRPLKGRVRQGRKINTCDRCRQLKIRCGRTKPACQQCTDASISCSFINDLSTEPPTTAPEFEATPYPGVPPNEHHLPLGDKLLYHDQDTSIRTVPTKLGSVRTRQRAQLSCARCRRLKVKCDRELPCSRCRTSGWGGHCAYSHRAVSDSPAVEAPATMQDVAETSSQVLSLWRTQRQGPSHWKQLIAAIKSEAGLIDIPVKHLIYESIRNRETDMAADTVLPDNFPFNSPQAGKYLALDKVHELLQTHRDQCQSYVESYLTLYQPIHPIVDDFEIFHLADQFWNDPNSVDVSWLAQYLMVLALGCFTKAKDQDTMSELCLAAEACLSQTPFMVQPDLCAIKSLLLMVIAKQIANTSCRTFDACWTFLGVVSRAAISIGLNKQREPSDESAASYHEWHAGQTLWSLVVYFCIQMAVVTGKPPLLSADDTVAGQGSVNDGEERSSPWVALRQAYSTLTYIVSRVNSESDRPSCDETLQYDRQIRHLMAILNQIPGRSSLYIVLDMFFRRILLALHRQNTVSLSAAFKHPASHQTSLECSLAILVHHRDLCASHGSKAQNVERLGRLFKLDFFAAMLTTCLYLTRLDDPSATGLISPPRRIIMDTLDACTELWGKEVRHSICFRIGHVLLSAILQALKK